MDVVVGFLLVAVAVLAAEVGAMTVAFVAGTQGIGFELCGAEDSVQKRILRRSVNTELACGEDSDCYCTDSMSSDGTDAISC